MKFNQFQKFIPKNGERIIFVEDGEPKSVLVSFADYQQMSERPQKEEDSEIIDEISEDKNEDDYRQYAKAAENKEDDFPMPEQEKTELTLDDLPF